MTLAETAPAVPTVQVATPTDSAESQLANEVSSLWQIHSQAQTSIRKNRDELKRIRTPPRTQLSCYPARKIRRGASAQIVFLKSRALA